MLERSADSRYDVKFTCLDELVPADHLLRKIDRVVDFNEVYGMVSQYYCDDNGRPSVDPVVLVKMALIQHIYGIKSLRQTVREIDMNIAYRWFIGYDIDRPIPHFATLSYAFATRFPSEFFQEIFAWILDAAVSRGFVKPEAIFVDATHIKANANKKKRRKEQAEKTAHVYDEQLRKEINADREAHEKKPFDDDDSNPPAQKEVTVSITDPDSGLFRKGEHKVEFAYTAHVACDDNNYVVDCDVTPGNVHDSVAFDSLYDSLTEKNPEVEAIVADSAYKTPHICKKVFDDGRVLSTAYKRPMTRKGGHEWWKYVYDEYNDCVICPEYRTLYYSTTNRDGYREYKGLAYHCAACPTKHLCTDGKAKVVTRHIWQDYIELAEDARHTPKYKALYGRRKETIERVFADAKEKHGMRYTLHRGLDRVRNWVRFKFAAMNLKKMALWA